MNYGENHCDMNAEIVWEWIFISTVFVSHFLWNAENTLKIRRIENKARKIAATIIHKPVDYQGNTVYLYCIYKYSLEFCLYASFYI